MPSFDVVSKVDTHEVSNAVDQSSREIENRFDFKGSNAKFVLAGNLVTMTAPNDFQLKQMADILQTKMVKRGIDIKSLEIKEPQVALHEAKQEVNVREGINTELAKKIVKLIKGSKLKVQAVIQGEQIRVTGKKRDVLQEVIGILKEEDFGLPLQYENFRE